MSVRDIDNYREMRSKNQNALGRLRHLMRAAAPAPSTEGFGDRYSDFGAGRAGHLNPLAINIGSLALGTVPNPKLRRRLGVVHLCHDCLNAEANGRGARNGRQVQA
ncbi:MAG: hypothetical protein GY798_09930 [Hyphomicrobiales bacterium]|nr:hypothetical protein [Hyphomicrobiales bacterium]